MKHLCLVISGLSIAGFCLQSLKCDKVYDNYDIDLFQNKTSQFISGYNKWVHPRAQMPIIVKTNVFMYSFGSIDDTKTQYTIQLLLRMEWSDERLIIGTKDNKEVRLEGGEWILNRIWTPSLHIPNNIDPQVLQKSNETPVLMHVYSTGKILLSRRILLNAMSKMDFRLYPMDKQSCDIEIESNELSDNLLRLEWSDEKPFSITDDFSWKGFQLLNYSLSSVKSTYTHTGTFSRLVATFILKRDFTHLILDIYIPSILFVITSWSSFWIEIPAAPARVTLGITTMLTLVTSSKTVRDKLPNGAYINAMDIWIIICTFFVFASLVEYAAVNFIYHKEKRSKKRRRLNNLNNQTHSGLTRSVSASSFISNRSSDSVLEDSLYNTMSSGNLLRVPSSQSLKVPEINQKRSYIKNMSNGGIELVVPTISRDVEASKDSPKNTSVRSVKFDIDEIDIANEIDRKCRYIFPLSFLVINLIYWTTLAMMSFYD